MDRKVKIAVFILLLFYTVGIIGIVFESTRSFILSLSGLNLLLTIGVFVWANESYSLKFFSFSFLIVLLGYLIEVLGVHTGLPFGDYAYGNSLGIKLLEVPLIIGINWLLLVFCTNGIVSKYFQNSFLIAFCAGFLMIFLDFFIEPLSHLLDFWYWKSNVIPVKNYMAWFVVSFAFHYLFSKFELKIKYELACFVFCVQCTFFAILNVFL
jgi:uncharacterized membrane protein